MSNGSDTDDYPLTLAELRENFLSSLPKLSPTDLKAKGRMSDNADATEADHCCPICIVPFRDIFSEAIASVGPTPPSESTPVVTQLTCGHVFCWNDLTRWVANANRSCPMCRVQLFEDPWVEALDENEEGEESDYGTSDDDEMASSDVEEDHQVPNSEMEDLAEDLREMITGANRVLSEAEQAVSIATTELDRLVGTKGGVVSVDESQLDEGFRNEITALRLRIHDGQQMIADAESQLKYVWDIAESTGILQHV